MRYILRHNSSLTMTAIIFFFILLKEQFNEYTHTKRIKGIRTSIKC